jgi:hypothetical protein
MLSKAQKERYVREGGTRCPFCEAEDISADRPEAEGSIVAMPVTCERCGRCWHERYDLAAIYELGKDGRPIFDEQAG